MLQGLKLNKECRKFQGLVGGSAVVICLLGAAAALGQTTGAGSTGYFNPVGQVGQNTPIANLGRVGGRTTTSTGVLQGMTSRGAPPSAPTGPYLGTPSYGVNVGGGGAQPRANATLSSLNQNAAMANQLFGRNATTSVLGRVNARPSGSSMDYLVPTFNTRAVAARASSFYRGQTPAAAMLDRNQLLAPKSALAQMASGPRNSRAISQALAEADTGDGAGSSVASTTKPGLGQTPAGLAPAQRQEYRTEQEFRGCLERGDDFMRERDFHRAKASYERAMTISPDLAEPYCRLFLVTLLMTDYAQSGMYLRFATRRAKSATDLHLNPAECTPSVDELKGVARTIGQANLRQDTTEAEFLAMAYLSWLLDDTAIMRDELERSARVSNGNPELVKLRGLLQGAVTARPQS